MIVCGSMAAFFVFFLFCVNLGDKYLLQSLTIYLIINTLVQRILDLRK